MSEPIGHLAVPSDSRIELGQILVTIESMKATRRFLLALRKAIADRYKLCLFDQATARQLKREAATSAEDRLSRSQGRDWTREELYQRAISG